jgi:hypothetical protein
MEVDIAILLSNLSVGVTLSFATVGNTWNCYLVIQDSWAYLSTCSGLWEEYTEGLLGLYSDKYFQGVQLLLYVDREF